MRDRPTTTDSSHSADATDTRALIRSEERLAVSTVRVPARLVRLVKYVVTETRTVTVQVSHEKVRLVEIDPTDGVEPMDGTTSDGARIVGSDGAYADIGPADADRWLVLSEERIAITTEVVPVERVRLAVSSVTEQRTVTEDVRREQIAVDQAAWPLTSG